MEHERKNRQTSWQEVHRWYDDLVGQEGHHYHQKVILPRALELLDLKANSHLLDLGCGQGILARTLPKQVRYAGIDLASQLIQAAKSHTHPQAKHTFFHHDVTNPLPLSEYCKKEGLFSHAAFILSLQNIEAPQKALASAALFLQKDARLLIVMNHPSFRIPRQSSWGFDEATKTQYRKVNSYCSPQKIPIQMHPGKSDPKNVTWSFHYPLSAYSLWLKESGFMIELIEEWCSDKESTGKAAKWENRARKEFPLFLTIVARKG